MDKGQIYSHALQGILFSHRYDVGWAACHTGSFRFELVTLALPLEEARVMVSLSKRDISMEFRNGQRWQPAQLMFMNWRQTLWNETPKLFYSVSSVTDIKSQTHGFHQNRASGLSSASELWA